jgi:hypothetical protein
VLHQVGVLFGLVLCLPEDRHSWLLKHHASSKLDNEKSPTKEDYVSVSYTNVRAPRQLNVLYRHFHAVKNE